MNAVKGVVFQERDFTMFYKSNRVVPIISALCMLMFLFFWNTGVAYAQGDCDLSHEILTDPNGVELQADCSSAPEAYHPFDFGDGTAEGFQVKLDSNGDAVIVHDYPYTEGELSVYTATLLYSGTTPFTEVVIIDDRPVFEIVDLIYDDNNGEFDPQWDWDYVLREEGVFTMAIATTCNGFAGNHDGIFEWELDGPEDDGRFGNWVFREYVDEPLVNANAYLTGTQGLVWSGVVSAPTCSLMVPTLDALNPFQGGEVNPITLTVPNGIESVTITVDQGGFETWPNSACSLANSGSTKTLVCGQGVYDVGVWTEPKATSEHFDYVVQYEHIGESYSSSFDVVVEPQLTCGIGVTTGDVPNRKNFLFECDPQGRYFGEFQFGNGISTSVELIDGIGSTFTDYEEVDRTYEVTLTVGDDVFTASVEVVMPVIPPVQYACAINVTTGALYNHKDFLIDCEPGDDVAGILQFGNGVTVTVPLTDGSGSTSTDYEAVSRTYEAIFTVGDDVFTKLVEVEEPTVPTIEYSCSITDSAGVLANQKIFNWSCIPPPDQNVQIDFGDGVTVTVPMTSSGQTDHAYTSMPMTKTYTVTLSVGDQIFPHQVTVPGYLDQPPVDQIYDCNVQASSGNADNHKVISATCDKVYGDWATVHFGNGVTSTMFISVTGAVDTWYQAIPGTWPYTVTVILKNNQFFSTTLTVTTPMPPGPDVDNKLFLPKLERQEDPPQAIYTFEGEPLKCEDFLTSVAPAGSTCRASTELNTLSDVYISDDFVFFEEEFRHGGHVFINQLVFMKWGASFTS